MDRKPRERRLTALNTLLSPSMKALVSKRAVNNVVPVVP